MNSKCHRGFSCCSWNDLDVELCFDLDQNRDGARSERLANESLVSLVQHKPPSAGARVFSVGDSRKQGQRGVKVHLQARDVDGGLLVCREVEVEIRSFDKSGIEFGIYLH